MNDKLIKKITTGAIIAALYTVLTLFSNSLGLANGQIQLRISEALAVLPAFAEAAIPGLFIGCVISNIICGGLLPDVIFGSLATFIAALLTRRFRNNKYLAAGAPVLCNTAVIPLVLRFTYGIRPYALSLITVFAGEFISAGMLGVLLYDALIKRNIKL